MIDFFRKLYRPEPENAPLQWRELESTLPAHTYDEQLPPDMSLRMSVRPNVHETSYLVALVEKTDPSKQLGFMHLKQLQAHENWLRYMQRHRLKSLWIDERPITALAPERSIGTTLWNVSHKIITPGAYRAIIDTSGGWTQGKIRKAVDANIFAVHEVDETTFNGKSYRRYLVQYL